MTSASAVAQLPLPEAGCAGCFFRPIAERLRGGLADEECCTRVWTAFVTGLTFLVFTLAGVVPALLLYGEWCILSTHEHCQRAVEPTLEEAASRGKQRSLTMQARDDYERMIALKIAENDKLKQTVLKAEAQANTYHQKLKRNIARRKKAEAELLRVKEIQHKMTLPT